MHSMEIRYDAEADVLLIRVSDQPPVEGVEAPRGVIVSYGEEGDPVSVEILDASERNLVEPGALHVSLKAGWARQEAERS